MATVSLAIASLIFGAALVREAMAETVKCEACVSTSTCEPHRAECVAECRARLFSIDPRRTNCIATCTDAASSCNRSVEETCRTLNRCR
jgi:hypothetical protein